MSFWGNSSSIQCIDTLLVRRNRYPDIYTPYSAIPFPPKERDLDSYVIQDNNNKRTKHAFYLTPAHLPLE